MGKKIQKLVRILMSFDGAWYRGLLRGVAASVEHVATLNGRNLRMVVDIGANRGQFALAAKYCAPDARIISFEPLPSPASQFRMVFGRDNLVTLFEAAIGPNQEKREMHISGRDDSSSLLPITSLQDEIFPGTGEVDTREVMVKPLNSFIGMNDIVSPALLKLDVQGFEFEVLQGSEALLSEFDWILCECSFVELYAGQRLAADILDWLGTRGFRITGIYNSSYDKHGRAIQADFLFERKS